VLSWVELAPEAQQAATTHCASNSDREVGGVLLGRAAGEGLTVEAALAATGAVEGRARLTFTHETWNALFAQIDADHPDLALVGWYHSHPDFGVFLSPHDLFIQTSFFGAQHQVAYVIDPVRGEQGVFGWRDGDVVALELRSGPSVS